MLGAALAVPPPGTPSRERAFCSSWLPLTAPEKTSVLQGAESEEGGDRWDGTCRRGLRAGLQHTLDVECRNWKALMDFEVRLLIDRVLEPCRRSAD